MHAMRAQLIIIITSKCSLYDKKRIYLLEGISGEKRKAMYLDLNALKAKHVLTESNMKTIKTSLLQLSLVTDIHSPPAKQRKLLLYSTLLYARTHTHTIENTSQ